MAVPRFTCFYPADSRKHSSKLTGFTGAGTEASARRPFTKALTGFQRPSSGVLWPGPQLRSHHVEELVSQLHFQAVLFIKLFQLGRHIIQTYHSLSCSNWISPLVKENAGI